MIVFNAFYFKLADSVLSFSQKAGQAPTLYHTSMLGAIVGAYNSMLSNAIWAGVPRLGFRRKDQADIVVFLSRSVLVITNTIINVVMTVRKLAAVNSPEVEFMHSAGEAVARSEELGMEVAVATSMFQLFFIGTFACGLVAQVATYPGNYVGNVLQITTGVWGRLSARDGERILEPMEFWLPWDYASHIQLPCCAFFPLLLAEPPGQCASRGLCVCLLIWCCTMYCVQRVVHLRGSKETFFTTARLDTAVLYAWGLPLALLAITAAYWAGRAWSMSYFGKAVICVASFLFSFGVYWLGLYHALKHQTNISVLYATKSDSYEAALARLRYSYFNTNPVHVLMSDLIPSMNLVRTSLYQAGKAYLQTMDPRTDARLEATLFAAEHGTDNMSMFSKMLHTARVFLSGAPKQSYTDLDEPP